MLGTGLIPIGIVHILRRYITGRVIDLSVEKTLEYVGAKAVGASPRASNQSTPRDLFEKVLSHSEGIF